MKMILYTEDWKGSNSDRDVVENCDYTAVELKNGSKYIIYDLGDGMLIVGVGDIALYPSDTGRVKIKIERE